MNKLKEIVFHIAVTKNFVSVHSFALFITLGVFIHSYLWAGYFAYAALAKGISSVEIGAIILAVTGPVSALAKYTFDIYSMSRQK
jgi:hypothetical protein